MTRRRRMATGAALAVASAALVALPASQSDAVRPTTGRTALAGKQVPGVKKHNAHHLSSKLATFLRQRDAGKNARTTARKVGVAVSGPGSLLRTPNSKRLVVTVRFASYSRAAVRRVEHAGGNVVFRDPSRRQLTVAVAPRHLRAIGDVRGVQYVAEELTPITNAVCDTTKSEGDTILKADQARSTYAVDGTGVKVGVLSDSFAKAATTTTQSQDIAADNLPGATNTCGHTTAMTVTDWTSGTDEGRAMAQVVHDIAPGAPIDFTTAYDTEAAFAQSIKNLAFAGAKVIVDDITYFAEPMYQEGVVSQAAGTVKAQGVDYFSSSGNNRYVLNGHEVGSYEAVNGFRPASCPALVTAIDGATATCHDFDAGAGVDTGFGFTGRGNHVFRPVLNYAQPVSGVTDDFDLFLIDTTTNTRVAQSITSNNGAGSQTTFEAFSYTIPAGSNGHSFELYVAHYQPTAPEVTPRFKVIFLENGAAPFLTLERETVSAPDVMGPTVFGHNGGPSTMSVGASSVTTAPSSTLNSYSSYGPVTLLFGPVVGVTPAATLGSPIVLAKPDIVATDCGLNSFFGSGNRFCGTSQAAPTAAAGAALLRQIRPGATVDRINQSLINMGAYLPGPTSYQGGGLIDLLKASKDIRLRIGGPHA